MGYALYYLYAGMYVGMRERTERRVSIYASMRRYEISNSYEVRRYQQQLIDIMLTT